MARRASHPRRRVVSIDTPEVVEVYEDGQLTARYRFAVDALACGHRIYSAKDPDVRVRRCDDCAAGRPAGFHDQTLGVHQP